MTDIPALLAALAQLRTEHARLTEAKAAALPASVRKALLAHEARYAADLETLHLGMTVLETDIKAAVLAHGASVQASGLQAVYLAGRVAWDDHALQGYAATHAELLAFRRVGAPSVALRQAKGAA